MRETLGWVAFVGAILLAAVSVSADRVIGERGWGRPAWKGNMFGPLALVAGIVAAWLLGWTR